jgi:hypothetical protein
LSGFADMTLIDLKLQVLELACSKRTAAGVHRTEYAPTMPS